jgi:hypothetical protein
MESPPFLTGLVIPHPFPPGHVLLSSLSYSLSGPNENYSHRVPQFLDLDQLTGVIDQHQLLRSISLWLL